MDGVGLGTALRVPNADTLSLDWAHCASVYQGVANMKKTVLASVCAGLIGLIASMPAAADSVLRVLVVQAPDVAAYVKEVQNLQAVLKKLGQPVTIRAWRATYAGPD